MPHKLLEPLTFFGTGNVLFFDILQRDGEGSRSVLALPGTVQSGLKGPRRMSRLRYDGGAGVSEGGLPSRPRSDLLAHNWDSNQNPFSFQLPAPRNMYRCTKSEDGVELL